MAEVRRTDPRRGGLGLRFLLTGRAALALLFCVGLVGLPHAVIYSQPGWAPILALITFVMAGVGWWCARDGEPLPVSLVEVAFLGGAGIVLTTLFWVRARLGVPGVILGDMPLKVTVAFGGWAWPALLLVTLYRRSDEGLWTAGARRAGLLLATGLVAGTMGYALHPMAEAAVREHPTLENLLDRPAASPVAMALTGGPRNLDGDPVGVTFDLRSDLGIRPRPVTVRGNVLPGFKDDISSSWQGTELASEDPAVVVAEPGPREGWHLRPVGPGSAVVTVRNRRARTWIGVWVLEGDGDHALPPVDVTGQLHVEAGSITPPGPDQGFADTQILSIRNISEDPVLGPLFLVLRLPEAQLNLVGPSTTRDPEILAAFAAEPDPPSQGERLPWVEILPGRDRPRVLASVLAPGEEAAVEILVTGRIELDRPGVAVRVFRALGSP